MVSLSTSVTEDSGVSLWAECVENLVWTNFSVHSVANWVHSKLCDLSGVIPSVDLHPTKGSNACRRGVWIGWILRLLGSLSWHIHQKPGIRHQHSYSIWELSLKRRDALTYTNTYTYKDPCIRINTCLHIYMHMDVNI